MATYEYQCPRDGVFGVNYPIGTASTSARCDRCGHESARIFSTPLLARTPRPLNQAIERAAQSAEAPEVVTRIPSRRPARRSINPAHARLPRP